MPELVLFDHSLFLPEYWDFFLSCSRACIIAIRVLCTTMISVNIKTYIERKETVKYSIRLLA